MRRLLILMAVGYGSAAVQGLAGQAGDRGLLTAPGVTGGADALRPDTLLVAAGGPRMVRLSIPGSGLTALRLSVRITEAPIEAGAAMVLQTLGLDRARAAARPVGARVEGSRTPWGIAYTVVGPREEFDYLAYVLRVAVSEPDPDRVSLERARARARLEAERTAETAAGWLGARLRASAVPEALPPEGTSASLDAVTRATLRDLWRRTHRREDMTIVLVGPEPVELVLASFRDIGSRAPADARPPATSTLVERNTPDPDVLRQWYGEARLAGDIRNPHGAVIATIVSRGLRRARLAFESDVQLWDIGSERVLDVTGAAYPAQAAGMRQRVQQVLSMAAEGVDAGQVAPVVAALRFELLAAARTPWGLAAQVGRYFDATGDPDAAWENVLALDLVSSDTVRRFLAELERRPVARAEVRP